MKLKFSKKFEIFIKVYVNWQKYKKINTEDIKNFN